MCAIVVTIYIDYDIIKSVINYNVVVIAISDAFKLHQTIYSYQHYKAQVYDVANIHSNDTHNTFIEREEKEN